jgi:hypothetical protein
LTVTRPKLLPIQYEKFGSIRILLDGRVRLSAWTVPGRPYLDFIVNHWRTPEDGRDVYDPANYNITANIRGKTVLFLHLKRRHVESAVFTYNLSPEELREAVTALRDAGDGIEQWLTPGLAHLQADLSEMPSDPNRTALQAIIPDLLESVGDIPIAKPWEPLRQGWERWKQEQSRKTTKGGRAIKKSRAPSQRKTVRKGSRTGARR